jgi:AcrR family transcriptional regulator
MVNNETEVTMGSEERRQREQQELKQRIVETAREIARTEGWSNVTLRKIADRIEYTHAALYSYFANKEQLLLEVLREGFHLLATDLASSSKGAETPFVAFRRLVYAYWNFAWRHPELYRVMYGLDGISFGVTETWNEGAQIGELAAGVVEGLLVDQGKPVEQIETKVLLFWSLLHGLIALNMLGRIAGTPETLTPFVEQAIHDMLAAWDMTGEPQVDQRTLI